jgi:glycosyltransferase involved in cell wall biosynthesis
VGGAQHRFYGDLPRYAAIFVATEMCGQRSVPAQQRDKLVLLAENGVDEVMPVAPHAGDARRLLFVGRLVPYKGAQFVIRALERLPKSVELTLAGEGPYRAELEALAEELGVAGRCHFLGRVGHDELTAVYQTSGVFVFPSVRESGGMVVLEAMAHGLPCVVAGWGGPQTYTEDAGVQLSVESPSVLEGELVHALERMLDDPDGSRAMGERSQQVVAEQYLWTPKAARLCDAMQERLAA